jgi:uncharacterized repeat protein (TIGR04076 family)
MPWTAHIDGGSRGNPGPAAAGVVLRDESGRTALAAGFFLGRATNNQAEYQGLLNALRLLEAAGAKEIRIVSDSELMVRQMNKQYRVKSPDLRPLYEEAIGRLDRFRWKMTHTLREGNADADALANEAMDARADVVRVDLLGLIGKSAGQATRKPSPQGQRHSQPALIPDVETPPAPRVFARVIAAPAPGVCPAATAAGQTFECSRVTPAGLCLHLAAASFPAILHLLESANSPAQRVGCSKAGCGAILELRKT